MVYELNNCPCYLTNNFPLKNYLFDTVKLVRNAIKSRFISNARGIAFDREGLWTFGNDFARNVVIFGVNNNSSAHTSNRKSNFLVLGEGPTDDINNSTGTAEKKYY